MKDLVFSGTANRCVTYLDGVTSKIHAKSSNIRRSTMIMETVRVKRRYEILNLNKRFVLLKVSSQFFGLNHYNILGKIERARYYLV